MHGNINELVGRWTRKTFMMQSGYYAGRKPMSGDLGSKHLELIFAGINTHVGEQAAANFVRFVNKLDDMAASAFIVAFEQFWAHDCLETDISQSIHDRVRIDNHNQAFAVVVSRLSGGVLTDEEHRRLSDEVKAEFIRKHQGDIPEEERREYNVTSFFE